MLLELLPFMLPFILLDGMSCILAVVDKSCAGLDTGLVPVLPEPKVQVRRNLPKKPDIDLCKTLAPVWTDLTAVCVKCFVLWAPVTITSRAIAMTYSMFSSSSSTPTASRPAVLAALVVSMKYKHPVAVAPTTKRPNTCGIPAQLGSEKVRLHHCPCRADIHA